MKGEDIKKNYDTNMFTNCKLSGNNGGDGSEKDELDICSYYLVQLWFFEVSLRSYYVTTKCYLEYFKEFNRSSQV